MVYSEKWLAVLEEVEGFQSQSNITWYRGQSKAHHSLKTGLFRNDQEFTLVDIKAFERTHYNYFLNLGHLYHNSRDWELVFTMQHHGVKTRLLDWTESFSVALFFALQNWDDTKNDACIWLLDPLKLNKTARDDHRLFTANSTTDSYEDRLYENQGKCFLDHSLALHPTRNNPRIVAQRGVFTIQGNTLSPLEEEHSGQLLEQDILRKITITPALRRDAELQLKHSGINYFTLFPDLDGLAKHVNQIAAEWKTFK
jgi:hypothetical protein